MIAWMLCACAALAAPGESLSAESNAAAEPTPLYVLSRLTSERLRAEATAQTPDGRLAAIQELCELHRTLVADERYDRVDKLKDLRGRVYSRLRRIQTDVKQKLHAAQPGGTRRAAAGAADSAADEASLAAADSLAASLQLMDASLGGPNAVVARGGRAGPADHGRELVDLIERTINPMFWDTNGGPGAIVYYAPLQCLVVRASGSIHERVGGVLEGVRAAGR